MLPLQRREGPDVPCAALAAHASGLKDVGPPAPVPALLNSEDSFVRGKDVAGPVGAVARLPAAKVWRELRYTLRIVSPVLTQPD